MATKTRMCVRTLWYSGTGLYSYNSSFAIAAAAARCVVAAKQALWLHT